MEIKITTHVSRYTLECIFTTAIEGGSNYWYFISKKSMDIINSVVPRDGQKSLSERLFEAVYDHGVVVPIHDIEDTDGDPIGELNRQTFQERLTFCGENYPWAISAELNDNGDAESSDVVFQCLALGDLVYG